MIHKSENQRRISELIRGILALGLEWVPVRENARTAVNAFKCPVTKRLYTTYTSGLIQRETDRQRDFLGRAFQGPVNRSLRIKKHDDTFDYDYVVSAVIRLDTEEARLERLLECLTTAKKRREKTFKVRP